MFGDTLSLFLAVDMVPTWAYSGGFGFHGSSETGVWGRTGTISFVFSKSEG
jgi:hypothetical protein